MSGRPDLAEKFSVDDRQARNKLITEMYSALTEITRERTTAEWVEICAELDIPVTPLYGIDDLIDHPHLKAVELFSSADHPTEGPIRFVQPPTRFSATPARVRFHAPALGQHSEEVLREAGYGDQEIVMLRERRIVAGAVPRVE